MRLKHSILQQYDSVPDFWRNACGYSGKSACQRGRCSQPATGEYQKLCDEIWQEWHKFGGKGKLPVMPPKSVECEKCVYSDKTLGVFQGNASLRVISRQVEGTIPVPIKGRKKIWLDNVTKSNCIAC